jgi:hypothetical protein
LYSLCCKFCQNTERERLEFDDYIGSQADREHIQPEHHRDRRGYLLSRKVNQASPVTQNDSGVEKYQNSKKEQRTGQISTQIVRPTIPHQPVGLIVIYLILSKYWAKFVS